MVEFWTSIPLMALAALVSVGLLVAASVADQRRRAPVPLRLDDEARGRAADAPGRGGHPH